MPSEHANLSASASARWLACPPSACLEQQFPNKSSSFAEEGTLAHAFCEAKLRQRLLGEFADLDALRADPLYSTEIDTCSDEYADYVMSLCADRDCAPIVGIEIRLDMSDAVPDGFGTGDCVLVWPDSIDVVDYKHGKGVFVNAEKNPQLRLYGYGALRKYGMIYAIKTVRTHVFQPRLDNVGSETLGTDELLGWIEWVKMRASLAAAGDGEFCAGDHCRFCRARAVCRARSKELSALTDFGYAQPPVLTDEEVGEVLTRGRHLAAWVSDLESYARERILNGGNVPGWKVVSGRSTRFFENFDEPLDKLVEMGYNKDDFFETKPVPLTAVEKRVGKKRFAEVLGEFVRTKAGSPVLAPEADRRPEFKNVQADFS